MRDIKIKEQIINSVFFFKTPTPAVEREYSQLC